MKEDDSSGDDREWRHIRNWAIPLEKNLLQKNDRHTWTSGKVKDLVQWQSCGDTRQDASRVASLDCNTQSLEEVL